MSKNRYQAENEFAKDLVATLLSTNHGYYQNLNDDQKILLKKPDGNYITLNLTPFHTQPQTATANQYFNNTYDIDDLLANYNAARESIKFEDSLEEIHVHTYAKTYLEKLFEYAQKSVSNKDAQRIGNWVKNFDVYVAVKCVESLLSSKVDLVFLEIAETLNWCVHFDHLAIRCGSARYHHAEAVVKLLTQHHGYTPSQVKEEKFYQFADGWNAYLLYKMLDNGQILRLFIDQSDANYPKQIIQHWNYVYGFTAHHLAIRTTKLIDNQRISVSLNETIAELQKKGIEVMTPTGLYTLGLLQQVFARPEIDNNIPLELTQFLSEIGNDLEKTIRNAKLLELVSRREMDNDFAKRFYSLYGLDFNACSPLHTAAIYNYFLPTQAAHVIKTSLNVFQ